MVGLAIKKLKNNLKHVIPYIVITILLSTILMGIIFKGPNLSNVYSVLGPNGTFSDEGLAVPTSRSILYVIIQLLLTTLFVCYVRIIIREFVNDRQINHKDAFKEGLNFYFRLIGIEIVIGVIIFLVTLITVILALIPVLGILLAIIGGIFIVYMVIIYSISPFYMFYHDCGISESLKEGKRIGKDNFWMILLVTIIIGVLNTGLSYIAPDNLIVSILTSIISIILTLFLATYLIILCKEDAEKYMD